MSEKEPTLDRYTIDRFGKKVEIVQLGNEKYVISNNVPSYLGVSKYMGEELLKKYLESGRVKRKRIAGNRAKYVSCRDLDLIRSERVTAQDIDE